MNLWMEVYIKKIVNENQHESSGKRDDKMQAKKKEIITICIYISEH